MRRNGIILKWGDSGHVLVARVLGLLTGGCGGCFSVAAVVLWLLLSLFVECIDKAEVTLLTQTGLLDT